MLSSRQKKTAETQQKDSSDGMKFTFRKTCFFIVSAWTFPCPHLSRKICLPLLKMLLVNWQKHWKWNLWSPESSVKELKQSQEWKRLQPRRDHRSLCSPVSCPPEASRFCCRYISPCCSPALPADSRGPHTCAPQTPRRTERMAGGCCCDALLGGGKSAQVWKMQCVCHWDCSDCVRLRGEGKKKHVLPSEDVQGEKKYHNL